MSHENIYGMITEEMIQGFNVKYGITPWGTSNPTTTLIILMDHKIEALENKVNDLAQALLIINKLMENKTDDG